MQICKNCRNLSYLLKKETEFFIGNHPAVYPAAGMNRSVRKYGSYLAPYLELFEGDLRIFEIIPFQYDLKSHDHEKKLLCFF